MMSMCMKMLLTFGVQNTKVRQSKNTIQITHSVTFELKTIWKQDKIGNFLHLFATGDNNDACAVRFPSIIKEKTQSKGLIFQSCVNGNANHRKIFKIIQV